MKKPGCPLDGLLWFPNDVSDNGKKKLRIMEGCPYEEFREELEIVLADHRFGGGRDWGVAISQPGAICCD
jgi:hypothetical protein